jgi:hypothetical protein
VRAGADVAGKPKEGSRRLARHGFLQRPANCKRTQRVLQLAAASRGVIPVRRSTTLGPLRAPLKT